MDNAQLCAFWSIKKLAEHPAKQPRVHFSKNGIGAFPQRFNQFLIPADVPHFIGQVRPMRLDEIGFELFALSDNFPRIKQ